MVLSIDEKSQIQALDRTQPGLPLKPGRCGTMTHDYKRNGTTTLFAALDVFEGKVIGRCMQRHRHQEFTWLSSRIQFDVQSIAPKHDADRVVALRHVERWNLVVFQRAQQDSGVVAKIYAAEVF